MIRKAVFLGTITLFILLLTLPAGIEAQNDNRAALIVDFGEGNVETRCVAFDTPEISGYELLERSGLGVETDFQTGGAAVCHIGETGCPANDCFCQCRGGGECIYWSYWHMDTANQQWLYSQIASNAYQISNGAVEGWAWGLGSVTEASPPPLLSFDNICQAAPVAGGSAIGGATTNWLPYILFALVILGLGVVLVLGRGRTRRVES